MDPPFAETLEKYNPKGLEGYLIMRESVMQDGMPTKYKELIFTLLYSIDNEIEGAKSHALLAVKEGLTMEELVQGYTYLL